MRRDKPRRKRNSPFKTIYIVLIILLIGVFLKQEYNIYKIKSATNDVQSTVNSLQQTQNDLKKEISDLHDLSHIERVARSEYKMIKPNEIPIIIKE